jgi:RES domain-containing protein
MKRVKAKSHGGRASALPSLSLVAWKNSSRLIPSKYSIPDESILTSVSPNQDVLDTAFEMDNLTNDRLRAEQELLPGIGPHELVFGIPYASIINAAFTHAHPEGSRFNDPDRGAWYAAKNVRTAQAEVAYHQAVALSEIGVFEDEITYDEYLADFNGKFHDLRNGDGFNNYLSRDSYVASQELAERLLADGSLGIVYPSVRHAGGECLVCFRPALVTNVRKSTTYSFRWEGQPNPVIASIKS